MQYVNMALREIIFKGLGRISVAQNSDQLAIACDHNKETFCP
jgi:hypothetical protein